MNTFSVIIPVYNTDVVLLRKAIDSVLVQSVEFELIIVSNGVTKDDTISCIESYKNNPNINIINLATNHGISSALNIGITATKKEWICFLDSDDFYSSDFLLSFDKCITQNPGIDVITSSFNVVDQYGKIISSYSPDTEINEVWSHLATGARWNRCYRREFLLKNKIFMPDGCLCEDNSFINNVFAHTGKYVFHNGEGTYYNLFNTKSTSRSKGFSSVPYTSLPFNYLQNIIIFLKTDLAMNNTDVAFSIIGELVVICCFMTNGCKFNELRKIIAKSDDLIKQIKSNFGNISLRYNRNTNRLVTQCVCILIKYPCRRLFLYMLNRLVLIYKAVKFRFIK